VSSGIEFVCVMALIW